MKPGATSEATSMVEDLLRAYPDNPDVHFQAGRVYGMAGRSDAVRAQLDELQRSGRTTHVSPIALADLNLHLRHHEQAIDEIERAEVQRDRRMIMLRLYSRQAHWAPIRDHPRFRAIMDRMAFP